MTTTQRKVIIEHTNGTWLAMDETGQVSEHATAKSAYQAIRRNDTGLVKNGTGMVITEIEWRNVPDGFVTPGTVQNAACKETP